VRGEDVAHVVQRLERIGPLGLAATTEQAGPRALQERRWPMARRWLAKP
jgi:hypothetical protein